MPEVLNVPIGDPVESRDPPLTTKEERRNRRLSEYDVNGTGIGLPIPPCPKCSGSCVINNNGNFLCQSCSVKHPLSYRARNKEKVSSYRKDWKKKNYLYGIWKNCNYRCHRPNYPGYERWGGRGISVHDSWRIDDTLTKHENLQKYALFREYVLKTIGDKPSEDHSLDRENNDRGYDPGNLRWATSEEQANNTRWNISTKLATSDDILIHYCGSQISLSEFSESLPMDLRVVKCRYCDAVRLGISDIASWIADNSLECRNIWYGDFLYRISELSLISGITKDTLRRRLYQGGWSVERVMGVVMRPEDKTGGSSPSPEDGPKVINTHWFGDVDKLPATAVYVGRGNDNIWGNRYSSKSGKYTKEEAVALHRVDLYRELRADPTLFARLKTELAGKDLACWCVHPKHVKACHAYNYLHVLDPVYISREYDRSILFYLMEDLRAVLAVVQTKLKNTKWPAAFLNLDISALETKCEIDFLLYIIQNIQKPEPMVIAEYLAEIVIELELLFRETEPNLVWWRVEHVTWKIHTFIYRDITLVGPEPPSPILALKRKPKGA